MAQIPESLPVGALPPCSPGIVVSAGYTKITNAKPTLSPGRLFSDSGSFEEKPVDTSCDPGKQIGPFMVDAGGKLVVRLTGNPPAPNQWSLYNYGASVHISYEPLMGNEYGPGRSILSLALPAQQTEIEGGAEWPGPGRLTVSIGAPSGSGPLTYSCFAQSYSAQADIVEVFPNAPAQPGMTLLNGANIATEPVVGFAHLALAAGGVYAGSALVGPDSDVTLLNGGSGVDPGAVGQANQPAAAAQTSGKAAALQLAEDAQAGDADWKATLKRQALEWYRAGLPEPEGFWADPNRYWDDFSANSWEKLRAAVAQSESDPLAASVELKLTAEALRGWGWNAREQARLQTFQKSREWSEDRIIARKEEIRTDIARRWKEFSDQWKGDLDSPQAQAAAVGVQRETDGISQEIIDLDAYRLPVLLGNRDAITWEEKERHPNRRELQRQVAEWAAEGMPMPDGYRDDPARFWADYRDETIESALQEIREESDPCEALLRFKMFMEGNQGEWTSRNWGGRAAELGADVALIWLPPNGYDALKTLVKDALGMTSPFGQAIVAGSKVMSAAKNSKDTYDRVMKEIAVSANGLRAKRMYGELGITRDWKPQQVTDRMRDYEAEIARIQEDMTVATLDFNQEYSHLLGQLKPLDTWENTIKSWVSPWDVGKAVERSRLRIQLQEFKDNYEETIRQMANRMLELQTYHAALANYRLPVAKGGCEALRVKEESLPRSPVLCAGEKGVEVILKKGMVRIAEGQFGPVGKVVAETLLIFGGVDTVPTRIKIKPDGTDYSVEKQDESAVVRVFDGAVTVTSSDGLLLTVNAGQQATLPEGTISDFDLAKDSEPDTSSRPGATIGLTWGLRLRDVPLDSSVPEPYGLYTLTSEDGQLAPGWIWQDIDPDLRGSQNATWEVPGPDIVHVTAAHRNLFGGYSSDAARLIHKATGDFDLEAELSIECEGRHYASSDFILFTPGIPLGYLKAGMHVEGLGAQYYPVYNSGRSFWDNQDKLGLVNRERKEWPDAPEDATPVRVKLTRRGYVLRSYWSTDGGETWTLSRREVLPLPQTLWVGWVFQRDAQDGPGDKSAVTTLRNARLNTAPLDTRPDEGWDVIDVIGASLALETELGLAHNGVTPGDVQAYSPWAIPGDFDLTVRYEAPPLEVQPDEERWIYVGVSSNDGKNRAFITDLLQPGKHLFACDMSINGGWGRWREAKTQAHTGLVRLVRRGGIVAAYYRQDSDWVALSEWKDDFSEPVYLDFRYSWKTPNPSIQTARLTIERLTTPDGLWFGPVDVASPGAAEPSAVAKGGASLEGDAASLPEASQPAAQAEPAAQPTVQSEPVVQPAPTVALPLPGQQPGIAEFIATPPEAEPGQWVTLSWRTSGGRPYVYRMGADGQAKSESSDVLNPIDSMELPLEGGPGDEVTFALGLLSTEKNEWIDTRTVKVKINSPSSPPPFPTPALPADPNQPSSPAPESPPQPKLGPFTFSSDFDEKAAQPINAGQAFPAGTPKIWVSWPYSDLPAGTPYTFEWHRDGRLFGQGQYQFWQSSGASWTWVTGEGGSNLPPGAYTFVLYVSGRRYEIGPVRIQ